MSRYIDADAFIERLKFKRDTDNIDRKKYAGLECAISQCNKAPTADVVEVRHGEWIWDFNLDGDDFFRCSVCGRQEVINGLCRERNPIDEFPYCHCGAKMYGERSENERQTNA